MEIAIRRLAKHSDKHLYSNLRKIRIEYIKNEAQIVSFVEKCFCFHF